MDSWHEVLSGVVLVAVAWAIARWRWARHLPPGPIGLPLFGYLPFLGKVAYQKLDALAKQYGPVYSLYLGRRLVVVLNSVEAVQEALSNPLVMDRPPHPPNHLMDDSTSLSVSNGAVWKVQRNFAVHALRKFGMGKEAAEERIQAEISSLEEAIDQEGGRPLDLNRLLVPSVSNVILSFLTKGGDGDGRRRSLLDSALRVMTLYFRPTRLHAYFPGLRRWMARMRIWGYDGVQESMEALSRLIRSEIQAHRSSFDPDHPRDYIDEFLAAQRKDASFTDSMLRGNFQSLLGAGSTPSRATLEWCLVSVATRQNVQERVFRELEGVARVTWSGRHSTPYTVAVMMEAMRHHTVIPISMLRTNSQDCCIGGFDVPRGSLIMTNIWGVHHDPRHWARPHDFKPERFLVDGQTVKPPAFMPFSYGKRNCPGEDLAWVEVYLFFASLVQKYRILPNEGGISNLLGIANMAVPHSIRLVRRS